MRDAIYVKDEDYRFSFLYGNYITLTSLGKKGLERIIEQRMSPLYVSVHATDIEVRTRMLGIKKRMDVVAILRDLAEAGIEIHTQVVLCPGWNDGAILEKTFRELLELGTPAEDDDTPFEAVSARGFGYDRVADDDEDEAPVPDLPAARGGVRSLAIVPVGLSAHREGLTQLDPVTPRIAAGVIEQVAAWQAEARPRAGLLLRLPQRRVLPAGRPPLPAHGQLRRLLADRQRHRPDAAPARHLAGGAAVGRARTADLPTAPLTVLTGELAAKAWRREFTPVLEAAGAPPVEVVGVANRFYGHTVTVAGLLGGADLRRALLELPPEPRRQVVLSPRVFNADVLTLDGLTLEEVTAGSPHEVLVGEEDGFVDFWGQLG